jgi:hypothetical protein
MTKTSGTQTIETLSERAKSALLAAKSNRQGEVTGAVGPTMRELFDAGLIGEDGGLTRKGTIVREKLLSAALDAAFS